MIMKKQPSTLPEIRTILFTSDLSEDSRYVFNYAMGLAKQHCAQIILLYVLPELSQATRSRLSDIRGRLTDILGDEIFALHKAQNIEDAREILIGKRREAELVRQGLAKLYGGHDAGPGGSESFFDVKDIIVSEGRVGPEIVRQASEHGCDVIVMGYKRRSGALGRTMIGSKVRAVLQRTEKSVWIVPQPGVHQ